MLQRLQQVLTAKFPKWITGTYGDGYIDYFTYNSLGQVSEYYYDIKDANGKTVRSVPSAYSYDLSGMVTLAKYSDGSRQERLTYTNGALNAIETFNDKM